MVYQNISYISVQGCISRSFVQPGEPQLPPQQLEGIAFVPVDPGEGTGLARSGLPHGEPLSRTTTERMVHQWHAEQQNNRQRFFATRARKQTI